MPTLNCHVGTAAGVFQRVAGCDDMGPPAEVDALLTAARATGLNQGIDAQPLPDGQARIELPLVVIVGHGELRAAVRKADVFVCELQARFDKVAADIDAGPIGEAVRRLDTLADDATAELATLERTEGELAAAWETALSEGHADRAAQMEKKIVELRVRRGVVADRAAKLRDMLPVVRQKRDDAVRSVRTKLKDELATQVTSDLAAVEAGLSKCVAKSLPALVRALAGVQFVDGVR
jgi:hypothetical protein